MNSYANVDLGYGPSEYGLLASFGFTIVFASASFAAGRLADKQVIDHSYHAYKEPWNRSF
jgi:hypothetical protein